MNRALLLCLLIVAAGLEACRCNPPIRSQSEPNVVADQPSFEPTYVGQRSTAQVSVHNTGEALANLEVSVSGAAFATASTALQLVGGGSDSIAIEFAPTDAGTMTGLLSVGSLKVSLTAEGLVVPVCSPSAPCTASTFDFGTKTCVTSQLSDGIACETPCLEAGQCLSGVCHGTSSACDDHDACTVDACAAAGGCQHVDITCPAPPNKCQQPICNSTTGCGFESVPDGTLCSEDDCLLTTVDVCVMGRCVEKPRPATARCSNRWLPLAMPSRWEHAMAFDAARQQLVVFGGLIGAIRSNDTWVFDGTSWVRRFPLGVPSAREGHRMAYDSDRKRVVLVGGIDGTAVLADTWEWDGQTWLEQHLAGSPPALEDFTLAYDAARHELLFIGSTSAGAVVVWARNASGWAVRPSPPGSGSGVSGVVAAYDAVRQVTVVVAPNTTWEWDGSDWIRVSSAPAFSSQALVYDASRSTVVLFASREPTQTWEFNGTTWTQRSSPTLPTRVTDFSLAYDGARQRVVLFGGRTASGDSGGQWELDASDWTQIQNSAPQIGNEPTALFAHQLLLLGRESTSGQYASWALSHRHWQKTSSSTLSLSHSAVALQVDGGALIIGGYDSALGGASNATYGFDGQQWSMLQPAMSPPPLISGSAVLDSKRGRVVFFGGSGATGRSNDTWEWNGSNWELLAPALRPDARSQASMGYDPVHQQVILFGGFGSDGGIQNDTWAWDGTAWSQLLPADSPSPRHSAGMAFDAAAGKLALFGGWSASANGPVNDTWHWDGANWVEDALFDSPVPRFSPALEFDGVEQKLTVFGGSSKFGPLNDTWVLLPP